MKHWHASSNEAFDGLDAARTKRDSARCSALAGPKPTRRQITRIYFEAARASAAEWGWIAGIYSFVWHARSRLL
jgi:hypothetical protein